VIDTIFGRGLGTLVSLGSTIVLARIVGPEAYGILGMATVVSGLFGVINNSGLSLSLLQKKELSESEMNSVFWLQLVLSLVVVAGMMACAPLFGWFYDRDEVTWVILSMAPGLLVMGAYIQHRALLRRKMAYRSLAAVHLGSVFGSAALGIAAALVGAGYWALVLKELAVHLISFMGLWGAEPWRPGRPAVRSDVRHHIDFGKWLLASNIIQYSSRKLDLLLLGYYFGARTVGFYERSNALLYLPTSQLAMPLSSVVMPSLARVQDDPERYRSIYAAALRVLAWVVMPISGFFVLSSDELVVVLLGREWLPSAPIFLLLGAAVGVRAMDVTRIWILTPLARTERVLRHTAAASTLLVLVVLLTAPRGPEAVAAGRGIAVVVTYGAGMLYAAAGSPIRTVDNIRILVPPTFVAALLGASRWSNLWPAGDSPWGNLAIHLAGTAVAASVAILATGNHRPLLKSLRSLRNR